MADENYYFGYAPDGKRLVNDLKVGKRRGIVVGVPGSAVVVEQLTQGGRHPKPSKNIDLKGLRLARVKRRIANDTK